MNIASMLNQRAVYWPPLPPDDNGAPTWDAPVEVVCRWQDIAVNFVLPNGEIGTSSAIVFLERDVAEQGVMLLGRLASVTNPSDPKSNVGAWEVKRVNKTPSLGANQFLRKVFL